MTTLTITVEVPDTLPDQDKRIGAIIVAALHARARVTIDAKPGETR